MAQPPDQECDSCGQGMSGYSRAELENLGWVWHITTRKESGKFHPTQIVFRMCSECCEMYAERRKAKAATT